MWFFVHLTVTERFVVHCSVAQLDSLFRPSDRFPLIRPTTRPAIVHRRGIYNETYLLFGLGWTRPMLFFFSCSKLLPCGVCGLVLTVKLPTSAINIFCARLSDGRSSVQNLTEFYWVCQAPIPHPF